MIASQKRLGSEFLGRKRANLASSSLALAAESSGNFPKSAPQHLKPMIPRLRPTENAIAELCDNGGNGGKGGSDKEREENVEGDQLEGGRSPGRLEWFLPSIASSSQWQRASTAAGIGAGTGTGEESEADSWRDFFGRGLQNPLGIASGLR